MLQEKNKESVDDSDRSPWDRSSLCGRLHLAFVLPLIWRSINSKLTFDDLGSCPSGVEAELLGARLEKEYKIEVEKRGAKARVVRALFRTFGWEVILCNLCEFISKCILSPMFSLSIVFLVENSATYYKLRNEQVDDLVVTERTNETYLEYMLSEYDDMAAASIRSPELERAYWMCVTHSVAAVAILIVSVVLQQPVYFAMNQFGMKCRIACSQLIFNKTLRLSQAALLETTPGQIVNLLSTDVNRFDLVLLHLPYLIIAPIQAVLVLACLAIYFIGPCNIIPSVVYIVFYSCIQATLGKVYAKLCKKISLQTDERMRTLNEMVQAIRVIKMSVWEKSFEALVWCTRQRERGSLKRAHWLTGCNQVFVYLTARVVVLITLVTYTISGNQLSPEIYVAVWTLYGLVRVCLMVFLGTAMASMAEMIASCARIDTFLKLPELDRTAQVGVSTEPKQIEAGDSAALVLREVEANWDSNQSTGARSILCNLSLTIDSGELLVVVGRVAAGKSSLLQLVLGELQHTGGKLVRNGKISYASQEAWIFAGSVRDNILFGKQFQGKRYSRVIAACCLSRDLELLPDGDQTIVGERGVSLSGGQKARINLARALYSEADIYLLDDPLSAVDAPVAKHIFNEAICEYLARKTVILATHQLQYMQCADKILVLDKERHAAFGVLEQVRGTEVFKRLEYDLGPGGKELAEQVNEKEAGEKKLATARPEAAKNSEKQTSGDGVRSGVEALSDNSADRLTYLFFLENCCSMPAFTSFILLSCLAQFLVINLDVFVSFWTDYSQRRQLEGDNFVPRRLLDTLTDMQIVLYYCTLMALCFAAYGLVVSLYFCGLSNASRNLHEKLYKSVSVAQMSFFDFTQIGTILNRFGSDLSFIDQVLPRVFLESFILLFQMLSVMILACTLSAWNITPTIVALLVLALLRAASIKCVSKFKQMEAVKRSPVYSHLSTTLHGLATIRTARVEESFALKFRHLQDSHSSAWFLYIATVRWVSNMMDWINVGYAVAVVALMLTFYMDSLTPSLVGLLVAQVIFLQGPCQAAMRGLVEVESQMASVQRIREFCHLQREADLVETQEKLESVATNKASERQQSGGIVFKNVTLVYLPGEPAVLRDLSFAIEPREKIGIVGRTGAGKSSIIAILFRLYNFSGSVKLDGRDTKVMPLAELRRMISIIPQEPVLFNATLRKNLDPCDEFCDTDLWNALGAVQLLDVVAATKDKLDLVVTQGGSNFSVGQRQLICLARAILRQNQILVLDEATANVDPETDAFIQRTIAQRFADCTVLTIAHRLITIVNSDRVLVLDHGQVREFAPPHELLEDGSSLFSQMVDSSALDGPKLRALVEESHQRSSKQITCTFA